MSDLQPKMTILGKMIIFEIGSYSSRIERNNDSVPGFLFIYYSQNMALVNFALGNEQW